MSVIRNTEVTVIRSQLCNTSNGHASGTPANRPYNGGVRNSEARNIEVPLYIYTHRESLVRNHEPCAKALGN